MYATAFGVALIVLALLGAYLWRRHPEDSGSGAVRRAAPGGSRPESSPNEAEGTGELEDDEPPAVLPAGQVVGYLSITVPGEAPGAPRPVTGPVFRIGRSSDNDLVLSDPSISRHHAEIRYGRDGRLSIRDLHSMNGVYVNDRKVRSAWVEDGDTLELGDLVLQFSTRPHETGGPAGDGTLTLLGIRDDGPDQGAA